MWYQVVTATYNYEALIEDHIAPAITLYHPPLTLCHGFCYLREYWEIRQYTISNVPRLYYFHESTWTRYRLIEAFFISPIILVMPMHEIETPFPRSKNMCVRKLRHRLKYPYHHNLSLFCSSCFHAVHLIGDAIASPNKNCLKMSIPDGFRKTSSRSKENPEYR